MSDDNPAVLLQSAYTMYKIQEEDTLVANQKLKARQRDLFEDMRSYHDSGGDGQDPGVIVIGRGGGLMMLRALVAGGGQAFASLQEIPVVDTTDHELPDEDEDIPPEDEDRG